MEVYPDCLPCLLRQTIEASRMATGDPQTQHRILAEAIPLLSRYREFRNSPDLDREVHRIVCEHTGVMDPYQSIKQKDIQTALKLLPALRAFLDSKGHALEWALKIAATGNILDSAVNHGLNLEDCLAEELEKPFAINDAGIFAVVAAAAKSILIIGDNAGESVFDRLLIDELNPLKVTYAVRAAPIINDVTMDDAAASGLTQVARVISTGCGAAGVILDDCSGEFRDEFDTADLVLCKGQGNYETLSECGRGIFFLLKAKCPVVSGLFGVQQNDYVFQYRS